MCGDRERQKIGVRKKVQKLTLKEIAHAVNGTLDEKWNDLEISAISSDTRQIEPDCLFVAFRGENFDGHHFIRKAFSLGAKAALSDRTVEREDDMPQKPVVYVEDTLLAFGALAAYYKKKFPVYTVGITGSVGKTSTKEMVYTVMREKYKVLKTEGNFNNQIGMPRTLFSLDNSYSGAVLEMGMCELGEISYLSKIARPDLGVITNIGVSHLENLGTRENILKAKLEILDGMPPEGKLILNADNDMLQTQRDRLGNRALWYGLETPGDVTAEEIRQEGDSTCFTVCYQDKRYPAEVPAIGVHNVYNALAAFLVGIEIGLAPQQIIESYRQYQNAGMRQRVTIKKGVKVIEDCYNASPDSMESAINVISAIPCEGKRIAVFGDMLELGEQSGQMHRHVGQRAAGSKIDELLCTGGEAEAIAKGAEESGLEAKYFSTKNALADYLKKALKPGDAVIFKASRGMKLEEVIEAVFSE